MTDSHAVIVLGMHRSGTSAMAGLLSELGVFMGRKLFAAQRDVNEKGFYENAAVVHLNEEILDSLPASWDQPMLVAAEELAEASGTSVRQRCLSVMRNDYAGKKLWGVKDPRMCLTLPSWGDAIDASADSKLMLIVLRHPGEVSASLNRRDGFSIEKSTYIWLNYIVSAWLYSAGEDRMLVSYKALIEDTGAVAEELCQRLQLPAAAAQKLDFVDRTLQRNVASEYGETALESLALRIYDALTEAEVDETAISGLVDEYRMMQAALPGALIEHARSVTRSEVHFRRLFEEAYYSWWWKLARPVKRVEEFIRQRRNPLPERRSVSDTTAKQGPP
ncbi:MAG: sulfotransferase family protein [Congregibacter sp.]